ncbi:MAG TPA: NlpC/P60 family protein [Candidatus Saccharimonadales bacterium]|nr:NlpC/P60 family protein [Candidatus Saccharimonadales bacterium]
MSELGNEIAKSAEARIGRPFRHHFKPVNLCEGGKRTVDECMERGMDDLEGYDCSGLVIASLCEALHISTSQWPRELRHTQQLAELAVDKEFEPGDIRLYYSHNNRIHLGIATSTEQAIHASGLTNAVERSIVVDPSGSFEATRVIAAQSLFATLKNRI